MRTLTLVSAIVVVLAANALVLFHVSRNRAGSPVVTVELTERELSLVPNLDKNAGVLLRLNWENTARWSLDAPDANLWFNREKLAELGFDVRVPPADPSAEAFYRSVPSRGAWVALESRSPGLVVMDVGLDPVALRRRHAGASKLVVAGCVVRLSLDRPRDPKTHQPEGPPRLRGIVIQLLNPEVWVPLPYSRVLDGLRVTPGQHQAPPRYAVTLAWGAANEPYVTGCRLLTPDDAMR